MDCKVCGMPMSNNFRIGNKKTFICDIKNKKGEIVGCGYKVDVICKYLPGDLVEIIDKNICKMYNFDNDDIWAIKDISFSQGIVTYSLECRNREASFAWIDEEDITKFKGWI